MSIVFLKIATLAYAFWHSSIESLTSIPSAECSYGSSPPAIFEYLYFFYEYEPSRPQMKMQHGDVFGDLGGGGNGNLDGGYFDDGDFM